MATTTNNWAEDILKQLNLRDEKEQKDSKYFIAFEQLSQKLTSSSPSPSLTSETLSKGQQDINTMIMLKENQLLKNENNDLIQSLNISTINNEKLELIIKDHVSTIKSLEKQTTKLKNKIEALQLEVKEKNKTIELINDEVLTSQIQYNVLRNKLEQLEKK
ncbi:ATG16 Autophagy protein 16 [Candida maltosa Xu316]